MKTEQLKYRIVGALVILALIIIFLPWLLNRRQQTMPTFLTQDRIPAQPAEPSVADVEAAHAERKQALEDVVEKAELQPAVKEGAWLVQLASFSNKAYADKLVAKLQAGGYTAFVQQTDSSSGAVSRVFVGPETQRNQAEQTLAALEKAYQLKGIVVAYNPMQQ